MMIPSRALHLILMAQLLLSTSTNAFQQITTTRTRTTTTTTRTTPIHHHQHHRHSTILHARKGNRGPANKKVLNETKRTRSQVNDVLDGITSDPQFPYSVDPTDLPPGLVSDDPLTPLIHTIVHAADMRKANDIVAMRVTQCTSLTNFVVIVSGTSRPQNQAIASAIAKDVEEEYDGKRCLGKGVPEGTADSGWILLDFGEVMVHVMTPKSRLFYNLDGQWKSRGGENLELSDVLVDETTGQTGGGGNKILGGDDEEGDGLSMKERLDVEKEIDPFWS